MASVTEKLEEITDLANSPDSGTGGEGTLRGELRFLFRQYRGRILLTYFLFNVENLLRLAQPLLLEREGGLTSHPRRRGQPGAVVAGT